MANEARTGYVYILHFLQKLSHAEHYIGCTTALRDRLISHAVGRGSRICQVMKDRGIEWELGGLSTCLLKDMRYLERLTKRQHNSRRYCEICQKELAARLPGTQPISIDSVPFVTKSSVLAGFCGLKGDPTIRLVQAGEPGIMRQIEQLMGYDRHNLGFIPVGGTHGLEYSARNSLLLIAEYTGHVVGYLAFTRSRKGDVKIQQTCVADSFRGSGIGRKLVYAAIDLHPNASVSCWVLDDLPANEFWQAIGFDHVDTKKHKTSGNTLNQYLFAGKSYQYRGTF